MGGQGLKLGTVPYLNAKPLTIALENRADLDLRSEPPSKLAEMLEMSVERTPQVVRKPEVR